MSAAARSRPTAARSRSATEGSSRPRRTRRSTSAPLSRSGPTWSHPAPASPVRRVAQQTTPRQAGSRSSSRNASSDGSSAHWTSSMTSRQPLSATTMSRSARTARTGCPAWSARTSGTSWRHTQNGGAPSSAPCAPPAPVSTCHRPAPAPGSSCRCPPRPRPRRGAGSECAGIGHVAQPRELVVAAEQRARHAAESIGVRRDHREMHCSGVLRRRNPVHVHLDDRHGVSGRNDAVVTVADVRALPAPYRAPRCGRSNGRLDNSESSFIFGLRARRVTSPRRIS